ncbi:PhnD/SsuA/transferrin family substrate-binding protein [Myxococcota bacterium]|nr:PhnD/SsuA/transferrin family substrate-binding protein [Myxococcota bacterium]
MLALSVAACDETPYREVAIDLEAARATADAGTVPRARTLRIAVAEMESPRDIYVDYVHLFGEVARRLGLRAELIQRRTYAEVNDLLDAGTIDAALLCTGGYLELAHRSPRSIELVAVPVVDGRDTYQALLIVPAASTADDLADLKGKRFAFTDELSLTGRAWVLQGLRRMGVRADGYFASEVYTHGHDRSINAVARGIVDGASVHGIVWEHARARDRTLDERVRVIDRSEPFGITPFVVSTRGLPPEQRARLTEVLLALDRDAEGLALLRGARIDRFEAPPAGHYDSAKKAVEGAR